MNCCSIISIGRGGNWDSIISIGRGGNCGSIIIVIITIITTIIMICHVAIVLQRELVQSIQTKSYLSYQSLFTALTMSKQSFVWIHRKKMPGSDVSGTSHTKRCTLQADHMFRFESKICGNWAFNDGCLIIEFRAGGGTPNLETRCNMWRPF